jgi:baculoviral IAP repeat-containing protein 6
LCTGPLDAQCRFLDDVIEFGIGSSSSVDVHVALRIVNSAAVLVHRHIHAQEQVTCRSTLEPSVSARSCFGGLFPGILRGTDAARRSAMTSDTDRDQLMCNMLRLSSILIRLPMPSNVSRRQQSASAAAAGSSSNRTGNRSAAGLAVASDIEMIGSDLGTRKDLLANEGNVDSVVDSPQAELSRMSQSLGTSGAVMTSTPNVPIDSNVLASAAVTDEQKTETTSGAAAATVVASSAPVMSLRWRQRPCSHDPAGSHAPSLADIIVSSQPIVAHLIEALSGCNSSTMAMILASSGLPDCASSIHDSFGAPSGSETMSTLSVGDGIFHVLSILNSTVSDMALIVKPLYQYVAGELQTFTSQKRISRLSEPLLWFLLRVLDCPTAMRIFLDLGTFKSSFHMP